MLNKNQMVRYVFAAALVFSVSACAYTNKPTLPSDIKTIYVETALNKIKIDQMYSYQPGVEMDVTNAIIRRFQIDGNLKIAPAETADAILSIDLTAYEQEGVRFNPLENVSEYRLFIVLSLVLKHRTTGEIIWREPSFSGNNEYFVTKIRSVGQREATEEAIEDLARKVVDRVVEDW